MLHRVSGRVYLMGYTFRMAQPRRKLNIPHTEPSLEPNKKKEGAEIIQLRVAANDNADEETFLKRTEQEFDKLGTGRPLEMHMRDIRALRAFRNAFPSIKHADPENLNIYVIHPEFNVAIAHAFGLQNSENLTILSESKGERRILESHAYKTVKGQAERKQLPEKQDIVIVMDDSVRPTSKLLRNVALGGWILWPAATANALRGMGKYKCMGLLEKEGASPSVQNIGEDFWKKAEIETDEDLKNAPTEEGVVSYQEAGLAVWNAYGKTDDIVKHYKQLIELAEEQNGSVIANGATEVVCTVERDGATVEIPVKLVLPLQEEQFRAQSDESLAIFKKRDFV